MPPARDARQIEIEAQRVVERRRRVLAREVVRGVRQLGERRRCADRSPARRRERPRPRRSPRRESRAPGSLVAPRACEGFLSSAGVGSAGTSILPVERIGLRVVAGPRGGGGARAARLRRLGAASAGGSALRSRRGRRRGGRRGAAAGGGAAAAAARRRRRRPAWPPPRRRLGRGRLARRPQRQHQPASASATTADDDAEPDLALRPAPAGASRRAPAARPRTSPSGGDTAIAVFDSRAVDVRGREPRILERSPGQPRGTNTCDGSNGTPPAAPSA